MRFLADREKPVAAETLPIGAIVFPGSEFQQILLRAPQGPGAFPNIFNFKAQASAQWLVYLSCRSQKSAHIHLHFFILPYC